MSRLRLENIQRNGLMPVTLTIEPGECVCLSGSSSAGKTLLLRVIADLDPHEGEVYLDEIACQSMNAPQWRGQVGMLPAESFWWSERVGDHFGQIDITQWHQLMFEPQVADWAVSRLSTGERQRLALLRLLSGRPKALLLDEPTASLDPDNVARVEQLIEDYRAAHKAPVLWVSHDRQQISRVSNRHFRIISGRVEAVS
ncbi:MAG: ABC transporter ATP-binding protein [Gammaproteobacteria bacterium]|nr:ABC transporter ATP-binding protein [Gammaproteobacteria bacterium]